MPHISRKINEGVVIRTDGAERVLNIKVMEIHKDSVLLAIEDANGLSAEPFEVWQRNQIKSNTGSAKSDPEQRKFRAPYMD